MYDNAYSVRFGNSKAGHSPHAHNKSYLLPHDIADKSFWGGYYHESQRANRKEREALRTADRYAGRKRGEENRETRVEKGT